MLREVAMVAAVGWGAGVACEHHNAPVEYEIPEGFSGWVTVQYAVPDALPLPTRGRVKIARIPSSGLLRTSTREEFGIEHTSFFFVGASGRRPVTDADETDFESTARTTHFDTPVVCCPHNGSSEVTGMKKGRYSGFYVGRGPAGEAPDWPTK